VKIGKSASETSALLTVAYGENAMKKLSAFEWHTVIINNHHHQHHH
jgi:hypothetical protein